MQRFVARQPIFDLKMNVYAYELLFRSSLDNFFDRNMDSDSATSHVIADSFLLFGIESLAEGHKTFINFTRNVLVNNYAALLPKSCVVIEILENIEPDDEVMTACQTLKDKGYTIALDDFVSEPKYAPLLDLADIVKVDFMISPLEERQRLAETLIPRGIKMLAEKVETREECEQARDMGYSYFQGYFFSKPVIIAQGDIPSDKTNMLRLLKEVNEPDIDFGRLADMIRAEVSLSYKVLRLVNSAAFGLRSKINDLHRALGFIGESGIRKWISLLAMTNMAGDKPSELVVISLVRARFFELLALKSRLKNRSSDFFIMGLFSQLEALVGRPLEELLSDIPLPTDVMEALLGKGRLNMVLRLADALEQGDWNRLSKLAAGLGIDEEPLAANYLEALQWPRRIMAGD
jgi:c-di-GMP-related signal transduction protein